MGADVEVEKIATLGLISAASASKPSCGKFLRLPSRCEGPRKGGHFTVWMRETELLRSTIPLDEFKGADILQMEASYSHKVCRKLDILIQRDVYCGTDTHHTRIWRKDLYQDVFRMKFAPTPKSETIWPES